MPSEQPPTRVEEAARALDKVIWLTDDVPHEVLVPARELHEALLNEPDKPALAQPQPRGEEAPVDPALYRQCEDSGHPPISRDQGCNCGFRPAPPRGEGDDLAARLEEKSNVEEGLRPARPTNLPGPDLYHLGRAEAFAEAAQLARASTHPEQSERVDPEQLRLVRNMAKTQASQSDPEQAPAFTDERRASHRRRADALNAVLAALEPASPTPTEQENDR